MNFRGSKTGRARLISWMTAKEAIQNSGKKSIYGDSFTRRNWGNDHCG